MTAIRKALIRKEDVYVALDSAAQFRIPQWILVDHLLFRCPWLRWDRNPFPKIRLFRWLP